MVACYGPKLSGWADREQRTSANAGTRYAIAHRQPSGVRLRQNAPITMRQALQDRRYLYSNLNYGLLAHAIAVITGRPYERFLRDSISAPLGLDSVDPGGSTQAATPYETDGTRIAPVRYDERGARDLVMTARDLAAFGEAHRAGHATLPTVLRARMIGERVAMGFADAERPFYGLGWMGDEDTPVSAFNSGIAAKAPALLPN
ncbi:MAG: class A beta-lactamase-related serine hydrolase [Sphingomonadales bacterium]|nr:MAG: class A beta-lactamase-related serine hydrolase [Sphingomonadales bacterium]